MRGLFIGYLDADAAAVGMGVAAAGVIVTAGVAGAWSGNLPQPLIAGSARQADALAYTKFMSCSVRLEDR